MGEGASNKILDGKYEVLRQLRGGGMGEIYLVRHLHLQQKRVIKILRRELASDPAAQLRFLREARLATDVKHPNVAILYDYARLPDESFYMVWEYIEGEEVHELIERDGPLPMDQALQMAIQALRGLESIHSAGVIHRDISPDNLMVTHDNRGRLRLKIIDLGLAKGQVVDPNHEVTQEGMFMGKLRYCSPEQAERPEGEVLDARTDIYSLGLVLYEMLTGRLPFDSESTAGSIFRRLSEDPQPLTGRNPNVEIPEALNLLVMKALQRNRDDRYSNAIEFIEALEPLERGLHAASTQPISAAEIGIRPQRPPQSTSSTIGERSSSRISQVERVELLAQIDRAARRMQETSKLFDEAERALEAENFEKALEIERVLRETNPRAAGLAKLSERLRQAQAVPSTPAAFLPAPSAPPSAVVSPTPAPQEVAPSSPVAPPMPARAPVAPPMPAMPALAEVAPPSPVARPTPSPAEVAPPSPAAPPTPVPAEVAPELPAPRVAQRPVPPVAAVEEAEFEEAEDTPEEKVAQAERILEEYLRLGKINLAVLTLETLLELQPRHPKKKEYQSWIRLAEEEASQFKRAEKAVEAGRSALEKGDFKAARKQLEVARRNDLKGHLAQTFEEELAEAERDGYVSTEIVTLRGAFDEAMAAGQLAEAESIYEKVAALGTSRVALTAFRQRIDAEKQRIQEKETFERYHRLVRRDLDKGDFKTARETVHTLSIRLPQSTVAASLVDAIDQEEQAHRRRQSVERGVQQVEAHLAANDLDGAALGLKILKQMDPDNPRWLEIEKKLRG